MKLCTFEVETPVGRLRRTGVVDARGIVDVNFACAWRLSEEAEPRPYRVAEVLAPDNMREFLEGWTTSLEQTRRTLACPLPKTGLRGERILYDPREVRLCAPVPHPASLRDFFAFEQHVKAGFARRGEPMPPEWYEIPVYYKSGHQNILGPEEDVKWPSFTERFDYELELAAVIGVAGRDVPAEAARAHIAGFVVMNDFSARDIQRKEMKVRLGPAKGKDWATALGPVLVTLDEIADPYNLRMTAVINGELWSDGNSRDMYWKFEHMIEFLTRDDRILPGDVIGSGTVGTGCGLELDRWLKPGDVMELEIEKIGLLRNRVIR